MIEDPDAKLLGKRARRDISTEARDRADARSREWDGLSKLAFDLIVLHGEQLDVVVLELRENIAEVEADVLTAPVIQQQEESGTQSQEKKPAEQTPAESHAAIVRSPIGISAA